MFTAHGFGLYSVELNPPSRAREPGGTCGDFSDPFLGRGLRAPRSVSDFPGNPSYASVGLSGIGPRVNSTQMPGTWDFLNWHWRILDSGVRACRGSYVGVAGLQRLLCMLVTRS